MLLALLLMVLSVSGLLVKAQGKVCGKGEMKRNDGDKPICQPCPKDTFMDEDGHVHIACKNSRKYIREIDYVEEWEPCTRERDAVVRRCLDTIKMFIEYDPRGKRYECIHCRAEYCLHRAECCSSTNTTAASTPATTDDGRTPSTSPTGSYQHNMTKCDDVVNDNCLGTELININTTCGYPRANVTDKDVTVCAETSDETSTRDTVTPALSSIEIVAIVASSLTFVALFAVCIYLCYRRRRSQTYYRTYEMANSITSSSYKTDKT